MEQNWLINDGNGSVGGGTGQYLVVLGQYGAALVGSWWYWVSMERNWLINDGIGSVEGGTG